MPITLNTLEACFIDGMWLGEPTIPVTNPANADILARVPNLGATETQKAIDAAQKAFPEWSERLAKERANILRKWYDLIIQNVDTLAEILTKEQGKPLKEAKGEILYGASFVEYYAEEAKRILGEISPTHKNNARVLVFKQPIGVVAAITPWNFPNAMITRKVAPALAAGCTVVIKPALETPLSALALARLAEEAGIPRGVLNVITGDAKEIGKTLCEDPRVKLLGFTGSTEVGKILMAQCASTVKKVALELGGNAPFIVFDDADLDQAVEGALSAKYRNMGQTCVCANRIFVHDKIYDDFAEKLKARVETMTIGNGLDDGISQGPLINKAGVNKVKEHITDAVKKGAKILTGGEPHALGSTFFTPTILTNVTPQMNIFHEETFGPVAPLFRFESEDEVIELANGTPFGLAAYVYTRDLGRTIRMSEALEFGMVGINEGIISSEMAPFGGVKQSGIGREGSHHGIEEYLELKYVLLGGI